MKFKYKDIVFNNKLVLNKGCIEFNKGQITIITGESGSGKTTLFKLMTKGNDGWKDLDLYQNISACPQEPVFLEGLTIREHIEYIEKLTDCHMSLDNYVEKLHLNELMDMYPSQLSGGMRQRAAFLRTYLFSDELALLDEPFSALDAITKQEMHKWYINIMKEIKLSTIFITHDIDEAIMLSDRIYIMAGSPGKIVKEIKINQEKYDREDFNLTVEFLQYKKEVMSYLKNEKA